MFNFKCSKCPVTCQPNGDKWTFLIKSEVFVTWIHVRIKSLSDLTKFLNVSTLRYRVSVEMSCFFACFAFQLFISCKPRIKISMVVNNNNNKNCRLRLTTPPPDGAIFNRLFRRHNRNRAVHCTNRMERFVSIELSLF